MSVKEIEEYQILLSHVEQTSKEESDNCSKDMFQLLQYFWCDKWFAWSQFSLLILMYIERGFSMDMYFVKAGM